MTQGNKTKRIIPGRYFVILIPLLIFIIYFNAFRADFTNWDDSAMVKNNPALREFNLTNIKAIFTIKHNATYQPLRTFSYLIDYTIGGENPFIYHLHNIILYAINCILIFLILKKFVREEWALIGAIIYAVHPIHVEAVTWIAGRKEVLSGCFFFLAFLLYMRFRDKGYARIYIFSLVCYAFSIISKPSTVVLPLLVPLYELYLGNKFKHWWKYALPYWLPTIPILVYFIFFAGTSSFNYHGGNLFNIILTESWIVIRYIKNLVFPTNLSPRYIIDIFSGINLYSIIGLTFNVLFLVLAIIKFKHWRRYCFAILWFYLALIPVLNFIPISTLMADRYLYISSFSYSLLLALLLEKSPRKEVWLVGITVGLLIIFYSITTWQVNQNWKNSYTLWSSVIEEEPEHPLAHYQLGVHYFSERGDTLNAFEEFKKAVDYMPDYHNALFNLSYVSNLLGKHELAAVSGERALAINPKFPETHNQLGLAYLHLKDYRKSLYYLNTALDLQPEFKEALMNRVLIYAAIQDYESALKDLQAMERTWSPEPWVVQNSAAIHFRKGNYKESLKYYTEYTKLFPNSPDFENMKDKADRLRKFVAVKNGIN